MNKGTVIIPAFNENENLPRIIDQVAEVQKECLSNGMDQVIRVLVVDDHSDDGTYDTVLKIKEQYKKEVAVECIRMSRRSGFHVAVRAGYHHSQSSHWVVVVSADGQDDPNAIPEMIKKWQQGSQIVWAMRKSRQSEPLIGKFFAMLFYKLLQFFNRGANAEVDLSRADFYLLDKKVIKAINNCPERNTSLFGLIAWVGFRQGFVEYERKQRTIGETKWNFKRKVQLAIDWIIAFSALPLRMITYVGFFIAAVGFLYALYIVAVAFAGHPVEGWASTLVTILFLGGIQMMMLGVVGEYLFRNFDEARGRPLFFVEQSTLESKEK